MVQECTIGKHKIFKFSTFLLEKIHDRYTKTKCASDRFSLGFRRNFAFYSVLFPFWERWLRAVFPPVSQSRRQVFFGFLQVRSYIRIRRLACLVSRDFPVDFLRISAKCLFPYAKETYNIVCRIILHMRWSG